MKVCNHVWNNAKIKLIFTAQRCTRASSHEVYVQILLCSIYDKKSKGLSLI